MTSSSFVARLASLATPDVVIVWGWACWCLYAGDKVAQTLTSTNPAYLCSVAATCMARNSADLRCCADVLDDNVLADSLFICEPVCRP